MGHSSISAGQHRRCILYISAEQHRRRPSIVQQDSIAPLEWGPLGVATPRSSDPWDWRPQTASSGYPCRPIDLAKMKSVVLLRWNILPETQEKLLLRRIFLDVSNE